LDGFVCFSIFGGLSSTSTERDEFLPEVASNLFVFFFLLLDVSNNFLNFPSQALLDHKDHSLKVVSSSGTCLLKLGNLFDKDSELITRFLEVRNEGLCFVLPDLDIKSCSKSSFGLPSHEHLALGIFNVLMGITCLNIDVFDEISKLKVMEFQLCFQLLDLGTL